MEFDILKFENLDYADNKPLHVLSSTRDPPIPKKKQKQKTNKQTNKQKRTDL
jgi:hypothetical protein